MYISKGHVCHVKVRYDILRKNYLELFFGGQPLAPFVLPIEDGV